MAEQNPLTREAFDYLAEAAGLDTNDPHMEELFPYVQNALAGFAKLGELSVDDYEPSSAFNPAQPYKN